MLHLNGLQQSRKKVWVARVYVCVCVMPYIVEYSGPSLHSDALEDSENSKQDVVKLSDAVIGANRIVAGVFGRTLSHATRELQLRGVQCLVFWKQRCKGKEKKRQKYVICLT